MPHLGVPELLVILVIVVVLTEEARNLKPVFANVMNQCGFTSTFVLFHVEFR